MSNDLMTPDLDDTVEPGPSYPQFGAPMVLAGSVLVAASAFLSWSYDREPLGDVSITGNPAPTQYLALIIGVLGIVLFLGRGQLARFFSWFNETAALRGLGFGAVAFALAVILAIFANTSGLINVDPGGWILLVGSIALAFGATQLSPTRTHADPLRSKTSSWTEIVAIIALLTGVLFLAAYALAMEDGYAFLALLAFLGAISATLIRGGFFQWLSIATAKHRQVLMLGAVVVAFLFPFTQDGRDANMTIATQIIVFAITALGLNIVVGLAGLLDLGYIAFLGAGAYVGALLSGSATSQLGFQLPFWLTAIIGACVASTLGLIIGTPTLRVSGDYLAIVTLAFGEIFRITVNNLDGINGPSITNGPNGVSGIPELNLFGFDFGEPHTLGGFTLTRYANYYFLLLLLGAFVILVFTRLNNSRIGRGWVAIREDERAAEAMGVNVFGLKLFAFAGGAFLAGLAGTIKAHQDLAISPDQFVFLESAFLLAAIVLGGMGTVAGALVGATMLKLLPEKLRFLDNYRLLMFGILLVLMMRFRPEGLVASKRRQLEFHEDDQELAEAIQVEHIETKEAQA